MARPGRLYVPLDLSFFDDTKVLDAGEKAGWLFLAMLVKVRALGTDGTISRSQLERLGIKGWQTRLAALCTHRLVTQLDENTYLIDSWSKHNELAAVREERLRKDRERKRNGKGSDSGRNGDGFQTDSSRRAEQSSEKQNRNPRTTPQPQSIGEVLRDLPTPAHPDVVRDIRASAGGAS